MSQSTHVSAIVRFDGIRPMDLLGKLKLRPNLGLMNPATLENVAFDLVSETSPIIPCGSEGSLRYTIWDNPNFHHMAAWTVTIWGDLGDYDNVDEIRQYFDIIVDGKLIRSGILEISVEYKDTYILRYHTTKKKWELLSEFASDD